MSENTGSSRKRKVLSATLTVAMAATMLLSGTLTYFYSSKAVNTFEEGRKAVVGHDDFDEGNNKDIYVENVGETPVWVRVKLTEDLTMTDAANNATNCFSAEFPGTHGITLAGTDVNAGNTTNEGHNTIHQHFQWTMGNTEPLTVLSAVDSQFEGQTADNVDGIYMETGDKGIVAHDNYRKGVAASGASTLQVPTCKVITAEDYAALPDKSDDASVTTKTNFVGWVCDGAWYYWSQMLAPAGSADKSSVTGLLLDNATAKGLDEYAYTYHINVDFQAVDEKDLGLWTEGLQYDSNGQFVGLQDSPSPVAETLLSVAKFVYSGVEDKLMRLNRKKEEANEAGITSAAVLYGYAIEAYGADRSEASARTGYTADELEALGDAAKDNYAAEKDEIVVELTSPDLKTATPTQNSIIKDPGLARALVDESGSTNGKVTKSQARAIIRLVLDLSEEIPLTFSELTKSRFPSLCAVKFNKAGIFADSKTDNTQSKNLLHSIPDDLSSELKQIVIQSQTDFYRVDLSGFNNLVKFYVANCTNLETITGLDSSATTLQIYMLDNTNVQTMDFTNLTELRMLKIDSKVNNIVGISSLTKLELLAVNKYSGDGTEIEELDLRSLESLQNIDINRSSIKKVLISPNAFNLYGTGIISDFDTCTRGVIGIKNCNVKSLDISMLKNIHSVSLADSYYATYKSHPTVLIRRSDQSFTNYPNDETWVIYEKVVDESGNATYYKHTGTTVEPEADSTNFDTAYNTAQAAGAILKVAEP